MAVPVNRTFTGVVQTDQLPIVMPVVPNIWSYAPEYHLYRSTDYRG